MIRRLILLLLLLMMMNIGLQPHYAVGVELQDEVYRGAASSLESTPFARELIDEVGVEEAELQESGGASLANLNKVDLQNNDVRAAAFNHQTVIEEVDHAATYHDLRSGQKVHAHHKPNTYIQPDTPTVYLSFDDGPSGLTPQVLDLLREEGVSATFFVLGQLAHREQETVKRIVAEGHAIGNHTYDHHYQKLYGEGFEQFFTQVAETDETIYQITGQRTPLFRAPGGTHKNFDPFYFYYMEQAGYHIHDWNVDAGDSRRKNVPAKEIIANVKNAPLKHEMHVLLHDSAGHEETIQALPEIIRYFKGLGYQFAPLSEHVEPVVFSIGKIKWTRSITQQEHEAISKMVMEFRRERTAGGHMNAAGQSEKLVIHSEGRQTILDSADYELVDGRFYVALDQLVESIGGMVVPTSVQENRYRVNLNGYELTYEPLQRTIVVQDDKQSYHASNMQMHLQPDGRLFVPLRATIELAAGSIPAYSLDGAEKEVYVQMDTGTLSTQKMVARVFQYL